MQVALLQKTESRWFRAWSFSLAMNLLLVIVVTWLHYQPGPIEHLSAIRVRFLSQPPQSVPQKQTPTKPNYESVQKDVQPLEKKTLKPQKIETEAASPTQDSAPVPLYKLNKIPSFVRRIEPAYPESERAAGREATVIAEVLIGTDGRVIEVRIIKGEAEAFSKAVEEALQNSLFAPGYLDGRPVVVRLQIPFFFKLR